MRERPVVTLPVKCSIVHRWYRKMQEIALMMSILYGLVSVISILYVVITNSHIKGSTDLRVALAFAATIGCVWFICIFPIIVKVWLMHLNERGTLGRLKSWVTAAGTGLWAAGGIIYDGVEWCLKFIFSFVPRLECIKDSKTSEDDSDE